MLRLALIGCGDHAERYHATPLARFANNHPEQVQLAAACDLQLDRATALAEKYHFVRAYDDWRQMLDVEKPDACLAIVPIDVTPTLGAELLERHIPVVLEKPLGSTFDDVRKLSEIAHRTGTRHMVSMNRRFMPRLNRAVAWARGQRPIRQLRCTMLRHRRTEGDFLWGTAVHAIDAMRYLAGNIVRHHIEAIQVGDAKVAWYSVNFEFENACLGRLDVAPTCGTVRESYEMFGENYTVEFRSTVGPGTETLRCWKDGQLAIDETSPPHEPDYVSRGEYAELEEWISALRDRRPGRPSIDDVMQSMEVAFRLRDETQPPQSRRE